MRIAYQGEVGSNAHTIAIRFANKRRELTSNGYEDDILIPLVSSNNVAKALTSDDTDFGIMSMHNNIGGIVTETEEAIKQYHLGQPESLMSLPVHHNMYGFPAVTINDVISIASHEQALIQTKNTRNKKYPNMKEIVVADTALAAKELSEGALSADTAVLCPKAAGEIYRLELLDENLEDCISVTTFGIFEQKKSR